MSDERYVSIGGMELPLGAVDKDLLAREIERLRKYAAKRDREDELRRIVREEIGLSVSSVGRIERKKDETARMLREMRETISLGDGSNAASKPASAGVVAVEVVPDLGRLKRFLRDMGELVDRYMADQDSSDAHSAQQGA